MTDFINSQVAIHGQNYVDDLFDSNFVPVLTDRGWRWLYISDEDYTDWINRYQSFLAV